MKNKVGRPKKSPKERLVNMTARVRQEQKEWLESQEKPSEKVRDGIDLLREKDLKDEE